jgi:prevent-host-death family protein
MATVAKAESGPVNMHEAKSRLSQLVEAVESGREAEIVIARNGKPAARLVPLAAEKPRRKLGQAAHLINFNAELSDSLDEEITRLFEEGADPYGEKLPQ